MTVAVLIDPIFTAAIVTIPAAPILIQSADDRAACGTDRCALNGGQARNDGPGNGTARRAYSRAANDFIVGLAAAERKRGNRGKKNQRFHVISLSVQRR